MSPGPLLPRSRWSLGGLRSLVLWVFLIALSVGFYALFDRTPDAVPAVDAGSQTLTRPPVQVDWTGPLLGGGLALFFGGVFWFGRRSVRENVQGIAALHAGRYPEARAIFTRLQRRSFLGFRKVAAFNLGLTELRGGDLEAATKAFAQAAGANLPHASYCALCLAALGREEESREWLVDSAKRPRIEANDLLPLTALDCREGRFVEALERLEARWNTAETGLAAVDLRLLKVLRAFAQHQSGAPVAPAEISKAGELEPFTRVWPELAHFVGRAA